jgi:hypothetical protein
MRPKDITGITRLGAVGHGAPGPEEGQGCPSMDMSSSIMVVQLTYTPPTVLPVVNYHKP